MKQATADVQQIRVTLGLPAAPEGGDLGEVPPDLIRLSLRSERRRPLIQTAAQLGVVHSYEQLPKQMVEQFESLDQGDVDRTLAGLTANAPARSSRRKPNSTPPTAISIRPSSTFATATLSLRLTGL